MLRDGAELGFGILLRPVDPKEDGQEASLDSDQKEMKPGLSA